MKKPSVFVNAILIGIVFLSACKSKLDRKYPYMVYSTQDEQIRYIITDLQLGVAEPIADKEYGWPMYEQLKIKGVQIVLEAWVLYYGESVKVLNLDQFYRSTENETIIIDGEVIQTKGLIHNFATGQLLDPQDVVLSTDDPNRITELLLRTALTQGAPTSPAIPTFQSSQSYCDNPYWPVHEGSSWTFTKDTYLSSSTVQLLITNVTNYPDHSTFTLRAQQLSGGMGKQDQIYTCTVDGIFGDHNQLILPFNVDFVNDAVYEANGTQIRVSYDHYDLSFGSYDAPKLCYDSAQWMFCFAFVPDVGPVEWTFAATDKQSLLTDYYLAPYDTLAEAPTDEPPQASGTNLCINPYWPVIQGAWWKYYLPGDTSAALNHTWVDTINSISQVGNNTTFNISSAEVGSSAAQNRSYSCDGSGWIFDGSGNAILPPEPLLTEGYQWTLSDGTVMSVHFMHLLESQTGLGIVDLLQITRVGQMYWDLYSYGVGPYGFGTGASSADLTEYYLPEVNPSNPASIVNECNHPYWPVKKGYEWHYRTIEMGNSYYWWTVKEVGVDEQNRSYFTILQQKSYPYPDEEITYYCHDNGIYDQNNRLILPPVDQMSEVKIFGNSMEDLTKFVGFAQLPYKKVNYDVVLMQIPKDSSDTEWVWAFAKGLGLIKKYNYTTDLGGMDLLEASLIEK